jgi:putative spermidine/putrescine transport system substrate-binding protein
MAELQNLGRRSFLKGSLALAAGGSAVGLLAEACGFGSSSGGTSAADKSLIVGFDAGSFQDWLTQAVTKPFAAKYGANVLYDSTPETDRVAKAIISKGHRYNDIEEFDSKDIAKVISGGAAEKLDKSIVTNWNDIAAPFRNDYWASIITYYFGIVYRKDKIPEGITSWFDLWKPAYKGRVGLPAFDWEGFQWLIIINTLLGGSAADFSKGAAKISDYYKQQHPTTVTGSDNGVQLFTSGQIWAAPFFDGRARQLQKAGIPVEYVFPDEGAAALGEGLGLMLNSNATLAEQYLNFALDPNNQIAFSRLSNYSPTNTKALQNLPSDMQNLIVPQKALDHLLNIDNATAYDHIAEGKQIWNQQVIG